MKPPCLIQRLIVKPRIADQPLAGFDDLYRCDYMGSSEFEWGRLPRSLQEIVKVLDSMVMVRVTPKVAARDSRLLYAICHQDQVADLLRVVPDLVKDKATLWGTLTEPTFIKQTLAGETPSYDAWWDIDNNWFLVLGEKNAKRTMDALRMVRDKKPDPNAIGTTGL